MRWVLSRIDGRWGVALPSTGWGFAVNYSFCLQNFPQFGLLILGTTADLSLYSCGLICDCRVARMIGIAGAPAENGHMKASDDQERESAKPRVCPLVGRARTATGRLCAYSRPLVAGCRGRFAEHEASSVGTVRIIPVRHRLPRLGVHHRRLHGADAPQKLSAPASLLQRPGVGKKCAAYSCVSSSSHNDRLLALVECVKTLSDASRSTIASVLHGASENQRHCPRVGPDALGDLFRPFSVSVDRCSNACRNVCERRKSHEQHHAHKATCSNVSTVSLWPARATS